MKEHKRRNLNVFETIFYKGVKIKINFSSGLYSKPFGEIFKHLQLNALQLSHNTDFGSLQTNTKLSKYHRYFLIIHSAQFLLFILHKIKSNYFFVHL